MYRKFDFLYFILPMYLYLCMWRHCHSEMEPRHTLWWELRATILSCRLSRSRWRKGPRKGSWFSWGPTRLPSCATTSCKLTSMGSMLWFWRYFRRKKISPFLLKNRRNCRRQVVKVSEICDRCIDLLYQGFKIVWNSFSAVLPFLQVFLKSSNFWRYN
jgi:hypothetical protein